MSGQRNRQLDRRELERREDPERDPFDDEREYREAEPPSPLTQLLTIAVLVSMGLLLIAYFVLELNVDDLGDFIVFWPIPVIVFVIIARGRLLR